MNIKSNLPILLAMFFWSVGVQCQKSEKPAVESFEAKSVLNNYDKSSSSQLAVSAAHRRYGKSSLEWQWTGKSSFGTSNFKVLSHNESPLEYGDHFPASPTLQMSLYSETPQSGSIIIAFEKNGEVQVHFEIKLNFKGWRRIWVPFYEMQGNPPQKGTQIDYDYFRISSASENGKLFFDDIIFSQYQDDRHQYPDEIVPFIKTGQKLAEDHWMPLIENYDRVKNLRPKPISMALGMDLKKLENHIDRDLVIDKRHKVYINSLREDFQKLKITDNGQTVLGPPLTFKEQQEYFDEKQEGPRVYNDVKDLGKVLKKLAVYHGRSDSAQQKEIETMFMAGIKYFLDQGWQAGSNGGTRHHIGYNVREITEASFIMRRFLSDNGLLNEVGASLDWLFNIGMLLDDPDNFHVNIDYLNTQSYYHLMLIFLFEKPEMQAEMLQAYSNYISITLAQQNEEWGFKVDGTVWHHNGHYPAYGIGAFKTVPKIIKSLSSTRYRIGTEGHKNFKHAFLSSRIYSQLYDWGFGNAGRHPLEGNGIASLKNQFLEMAYSGNPEGTSKIDKDVAAAYLRLWGADDVMNSSVFTQINGIPKEKLSGYYTFPYAATAVHRRHEWAALIKGYSKYVWASEIYVDANRYGRYPANGTIELLNRGGETGSGIKQEGWDWNRYPGATVIYLPFKKLEPKTPLIMFRSDESFVGTTKLNSNGIFGMILNENKGSNADGNEVNIGFPGKLKAKKSVFSFGDKLICIGTDISSIDTENPTQTNIFQTSLTDTKALVHTSSETIKKFPYKTTLKQGEKSGSWLIDPYGNGYHILSDTPVEIKKEHQKSYNNKYSINNGNMGASKLPKETEGDFASAWIDHGVAPKNASYQYVIYPFMDKMDQKNFGNKLKNDNSFAIERADGVAHIVLDKKTNTTGYVVFEANQNLKNGVLKEVSAPALVMIDHKSNNVLTVSAVQPDLNFPVKENGKFKNYSKPVELTITLEGKWSAFPADFITNIDNSGDNTVVTLECVNGLSREFTMNKL